MVTRCTSWAYVAAVLLLTSVSTAQAKYSGGTGEPNDPYQIATAGDLIALGETPADYDKHFLLTADIDLDPNLPGRKVFDKAVIRFFAGVFDGNGHTISHLTINGGDYLGLFGQLSPLWFGEGGPSEVKNLGLVDVDITGSGVNVGGLVGSNYQGRVVACFWDTETSGQTASAGGTGKTTSEMQTAKTFLDAGWDFVGETANGTEEIWKIAEGLDYPRLWWEPYDGRVTVVLGQIFTVTLESNPSRGYRWEWVDHQDSIVEQVGQAQFKPRETGEPPLVGAGGWESFDFKAVKQGQMTLKLVYRRPWEEAVEPLKTFSLQVTVP